MEISKRPVKHSFRIEPENYEYLQAEAERRGISLSGLVNQIVKEYVVNKHFDRIGSVPMPKDVLREIFDVAQTDLLVEGVRKIGSNDAVEYVGTLYHDINNDSVLKFLDLWFSRFPNYEHRNHSAKHSFSVTHDINEKYSKYIKELVSALVEKTMGRPVRFIQITPRSITFSIDID
ncbi:MAG: hypothetical protein QXN83_08295 [Nitrososphaerales archaeon]